MKAVDGLGNRGIGLIEAMIGVAIIAIGMLAFSNQFSNQMAGQKSVKSTAELHSAVDEIQQAFAANGVCKPNLAGIKFDKTQLTPKGDYPAAVISKIALPSAPNDPLITSGAALHNLPGSNVDLTLVNVLELTANSSYLGKIRFLLTKDDKSSSNVSGAKSSPNVLGPNTIYRDLPVTLKVSAVGNQMTVTDCYTGSQNSGSLGEIGAWKVDSPSSYDSSVDPGSPTCPQAMLDKMGTVSDPSSVTGFCSPVGAKCQMSWMNYNAQSQPIGNVYLKETCVGYATAPGGSGGGGAEGSSGNSDSAGSAGGNGAS